MSEENRQEHIQHLRTLSDGQILFLYATRMSRLATFQKLRTPAVILNKAIELAAEIQDEAKRRKFSSACLQTAVKDEKMERRVNRAS